MWKKENSSTVFPQLFLFKDLPSLAVDLLKCLTEHLPQASSDTIYCCHENMNYRMLNIWSGLLSQSELLGQPSPELWPSSEEDECLEKGQQLNEEKELKGKGLSGGRWGERVWKKPYLMERCSAPCKIVGKAGRWLPLLTKTVAFCTLGAKMFNWSIL